MQIADFQTHPDNFSPIYARCMRTICALYASCGRIYEPHASPLQIPWMPAASRLFFLQKHVFISPHSAQEPLQPRISPASPTPTHNAKGSSDPSASLPPISSTYFLYKITTTCRTLYGLLKLIGAFVAEIPGFLFLHCRPWRVFRPATFGKTQFV